MDRDIFDTEEFNLLLEYLSAHKKEFLKDFLRERGLFHSYNKDELMQKVREYVEEDRLSFEELVELLNTIEGWGDQHIYLYDAPAPLSARWRDPIEVRKILDDAGYDNLFNNSLPMVLPDDATLSSIQWSTSRVRFVWVDKRTWREHDETLDYTQQVPPDRSTFFREEIEWRAYRVRTGRGLIAFDWDLISGDAMLLIQRIPRSRVNSYREVRDQFEGELRPFVDLSAFDRVRVSHAVRSLELSDETRRYQLKYLSDYRGQLTVTSPNSKTDVFTDDPVIERTRAALDDEETGESGATGLLGRFYWQPVPTQLTREIYTLIYGEDDDDQRVGIYAEHLEGDVRYVLSRIRHYSR